MTEQTITAEQLITELGMAPHPEGGFFVETFKDPAIQNGRSVGTAIYYLLQKDEHSHWHKVDAAEIWHFYAGSPLNLMIAADAQSNPITYVLGRNFAIGQRPQLIVPAQQWQSAHCTGAWTLVGCTVSPGFEFSGFEMAPNDWKPGIS